MARNEIARLFDEHAGRAYRYARAMGLAPADADDAVAESFLHVVQSWDSYRGQSAFSTWLFTVVRNTVRDMARGESRRRARHEFVGPGPRGSLAPGADARAEDAEMRDAVSRAFAALDPETRGALSLVAAGGLSYGDAAAVEGTTVAALATRVFRARKAVREALVSQGLMEA